MIYSENILICIAVPLIVSMLFIQGNARRFVFGFLVGMATCLLAAYISGYIDLVAGNGRDWTAVYVSPIVEEIMKLLPPQSRSARASPPMKTAATSSPRARATSFTFSSAAWRWA